MNGNRRRLLHIDDDPQTLRFVAAALSAHGFEVISLSDASRLDVALLESDARVVLLDIDMPDKNGLDILSEIKQHDGGIQVVMLTGLVSMNTLMECMRRGAEACVFKPISDVEQLTEVLHAAFEKLDRWWTSLRVLRQRKQALAEDCSTHR